MNNLATELLVKVLSQLRYLQLVRSRRVCRRFHLTIDGTAALQLQIELGAAGYYPQCPIGRSAGDALKRFRNTQRAYRDPKLRLRELPIDSRIYVPPDRSSKHVPGKGAWGRRGDFLVASTCIGPSYNNETTQIDILWLGSAPLCEENAQNRNLATHRWRTLLIDGSRLLLDFAPAEDLLLLQSDSYLHFHSFATGKPHTRVSEAYIPDPGRGGTTRVVDISGHWLLLASFGRRGGATGIHLYHWPSGVLSMRWDFRNQPGLLGCILDSYVVIHRCTEAEALPNAALGSIDVYALAKSHEPSTEPTLVARHALPDVRGGDGFLLNLYRGTGSAWGRTPPLLSITSDVGSYLLPLSDLLPDDITLGSDIDRSPTTPIPWGRWSLGRGLCIEPLQLEVADSDFVALAGRHLIFTQAIVELNPYDALRNIYDPHISVTDARDQSTDSIEELAIDSSQNRRPTALPGDIFEICPGTDEDIEPAHLRSLWVRKTPLPYPTDSSASAYFIEEEDGPKLVEVVWQESWSGGPLSLKVWSFE